MQSGRLREPARAIWINMVDIGNCSPIGPSADGMQVPKIGASHQKSLDRWPSGSAFAIPSGIGAIRNAHELAAVNVTN